MNKKKNIRLHLRWLLLGICSIFLMGGCVSGITPIPYASTVSPEKTCTLNFSSTLSVSSFNGENVTWKAAPMDSWVSVKIPAEGNHTFVLHYDRAVYEKQQYRHGISITHGNFIAGHTYEIVAAAGAEAGGFTGLFTNMLGAMLDTVNKTLRIGIRDITNGQQGDYTWLPWTSPE